jgi:hypothetical protein
VRACTFVAKALLRLEVTELTSMIRSLKSLYIDLSIAYPRSFIIDHRASFAYKRKTPVPENWRFRGKGLTTLGYINIRRS